MSDSPPAKEATAPALQTSKRKFYKLLDSLTANRPSSAASKSSNPITSAVNNKSSTSLAPSTKTAHGAEPPSKRLRPVSQATSSSVNVSNGSGIVGANSSIRVVRSISRESLRSTSSSRPITAATTVGKSPFATSTSAAPNYAPWSQDAFLERLHTFSNITRWTPKPDPVNEVAWAKRGWLCDVPAYNTVACKGGCEARVAVRLRPAAKDVDSNAELPETEDMLAEIGEELIAAVEKQIVEGHRENCLWRRNGCKDDIYRIKMADPAVWQKELSERYWSITHIEDYIPENVRLPDAYELDSVLKSLPTQLLQNFTHPDSTVSRTDNDDSEAAETPETPTKGATQRISVAGGIMTPQRGSSAEINKNALALALFGWSATTKHSLQIVHCTRCFARQGLWLLTSKNVGDLTRPEPPLPPMAFKVDEAHREHCPWVNSLSQRGLGSFEKLNGWQVLVELIKAQRGRHRPDQEELLGESDAWDENSSPSREDIAKMDKEREGKLKRLKRAFTVKKTPGIKKG